MNENDVNEQVVEENTQATQENTQATLSSVVSPLNVKMKIVDAFILAMVIAATIFISEKAQSFADNQAGLILSGVAGGVLGSVVPRRN